MKLEKTTSMSHQYSSADSEQIPSQPLDLKKHHKSEDDDHNMEQEHDKDVAQKQSPSSVSKTHLCNKEKIALQQQLQDATKENLELKGLGGEDSGRERLKRHRVEVAGRVWIPEIWGQEELLKDWIDCSAFDAPFVPSRIVMARQALVEEGTRRANAIAAAARGLRIANRC